MRRLFYAVIFGASLAASSLVIGAPVLAQDAPHQEILDRDREVSVAVRRSGEILTNFLGDPRFTSPANPAALAATVEAETAALTAARTELLQISEALSGLPPLAGSGRSADLDRRDQHRENIAAIVVVMAGIFDHFLSMPALAEAGDEAGVRAAYRSVMVAGSMQQTMQAAGLRGQAATLPYANADNAKLIAMACLSEGLAALQNGVLAVASHDRTIQALSDAETCVHENIERGRSYVAAAPDAFSDIHTGYYDALADGASWVTDVKLAFSRNMPSGQIASTYNPPYNAVADRLQQLVVRERDLIAAEYGLE